MATCHPLAAPDPSAGAETGSQNPCCGSGCRGYGATPAESNKSPVWEWCRRSRSMGMNEESLPCPPPSGVPHEGTFTYSRSLLPTRGALQTGGSGRSPAR